jgi:biotin operon repressor
MKTKDVINNQVESSELLKKLKKGPQSAEELAKHFKTTPKKIIKLIDELISKGSMIFQTAYDEYDLQESIHLEPGQSEVQGTKEYWTHQFGFTTDNHLCNKHSRLDVLNAAYNHFAAEGIKIVYNAGNILDGEAKFNKTELVTAPGMDNQVDYFIEQFPYRSGIKTHFIAGDDHEGWYQQREGIEIGRYMALRAEQAGRDDFEYLGYAEADVKLTYGSGSSVMRVVHPGGGSSYAISYTDQKRVESYQGGEKPHIELVGHYHKFNHGYPREVHTLQGGCTCDQTMFMRKKRLQAHVGYSIIKIKQDEDGSIKRFSVDWFPFFDRKFYEKRFG